ncbi:MAG: oligosaccharide flippase family protein, partial [Bacteroidota bacterium]
MGIIIRQSIKNSLINYLGVLIAAVSTIWIYPYDKTTYGLVQFIQAAAMTALPFLLAGANFVSIRFFPEFKNETNGHHGYFGILSLLVFSGFVFFGLAYWLLEDQIAWLYSDKSDVFKAYIPYILPLAMLIGIMHFCVSYAANFKRIAVPAIFTNLIKVSLPVLILAHYWSYITLDQLVWGVLLNFTIAMLGALGYLWWLGEIKWSINWTFLNPERRKRMLQYAVFGMASGVGGVLAFRIDAVMVPSLIDFKSNGVYNLAMFIGNAIAISSTALLAIASPIISAAFKNNDMAEIRDIYQKSSANLLIAGTLFFCLILPNVNDLFSIMPKSEEMVGGYWVVFFIGLTKVIEMGTSVNHQIINHSDFYRLNLVMIFIL